MKSVRAKHLVPNCFTLANIGFGFLAILSASEAHFERAVLCLFGAAVCDLVDGRAARILQATSKFGMELDSLSDLVSFGVAPAVTLYLASLRGLGPIGAVVAVGYLLTGALRLARYNLGAAPLGEVTFEGVPIPVAAGYVMSFVMLRGSAPAWLLGLGTAALSLLMVTKLKIPKFRKGGLPIWLMLIGMALFTIFLKSPHGLTWHLWNGWNLVLLLANYGMLKRHGLLATRKERPYLRRAA